jgi:hypothetical protein
MERGTESPSDEEPSVLDEAGTRHILSLIEHLASTVTEADAVSILTCATRTLGADVGQFTSVIRDDDSLTSYRVLHAGNPAWASRYGHEAWWRHDPWLRYTLRHAEPICGSTFMQLSEGESAVRVAAHAAGFVHMLVIPSPSTAAQSRVGVLCLGSRHEGFLSEARIPALRSYGRALAMELSDWTQRFIRAELVTKDRITEADLVLLQHELEGHSSKAIAVDLGIEAKTIDCRFRRLSVRMSVGNRRAAARLAELYGLL